MSISVIIPVWNGRVWLEKLLDSLDRQTLPPAEVLVVDNGSGDGAPEAAERRGARVLRLGRNTGFAHAVNRGVESARHPWLAIVNSDVELEPEWLGRLRGAEAPFASGPIFSALEPGLMDGAFDLLCRGGCPWRAGNGKAYRAEQFPAQPIACASFTAGLFRGDLFRAVGLLDERFESYLEDVDFGLRCLGAGVAGRFVPAAICRHRGSAALGKWHAATVRRMARNQVYLIAKHYPRRLVWRWLWPILAAHGLWGALALRHGTGTAWLRGKYAALRHLPRYEASISGPLLESALREQEAALLRLQRELGMDWYWRAYQTLVAGSKVAGSK